MKKIDIIKANSDYGVDIEGTDRGPKLIVEGVDLDTVNKINEVNKKVYPKEKDKENKRKNINYINEFNSELYNSVSKSINHGCIPIVVGGDHSISIASALASINKHKDLGIIWIDSHADFNNFNTTITGNIHGVPFATITGQNQEGLTDFYKGDFYNPKNSVLLGARCIDKPGEYDNLKKAGVTVFSTEDIKNKGIEKVIKEAIQIANNKTKGMHISIDIDVLDPKVAPGVSVPEENGITECDLNEVIDEIFRIENRIKSIDLVEYNPRFDINEKTLNVAKSLLNKLIKLLNKNN